VRLQTESMMVCVDIIVRMDVSDTYGV